MSTKPLGAGSIRFASEVHMWCYHYEHQQPGGGRARLDDRPRAGSTAVREADGRDGEDSVKIEREKFKSRRDPGSVRHRRVPSGPAEVRLAVLRLACESLRQVLPAYSSPGTIRPLFWPPFKAVFRGPSSSIPHSRNSSAVMTRIWVVHAEPMSFTTATELWQPISRSPSPAIPRTHVDHFFDVNKYGHIGPIAHTRDDPFPEVVYSHVNYMADHRKEHREQLITCWRFDTCVTPRCLGALPLLWNCEHEARRHQRSRYISASSNLITGAVSPRFWARTHYANSVRPGSEHGKSTYIDTKVEKWMPVSAYPRATDLSCLAPNISIDADVLYGIAAFNNHHWMNEAVAASPWFYYVHIHDDPHHAQKLPRMCLVYFKSQGAGGPVPPPSNCAASSPHTSPTRIGRQHWNTHGFFSSAAEANAFCGSVTYGDQGQSWLKLTLAEWRESLRCRWECISVGQYKHPLGRPRRGQCGSRGSAQQLLEPATWRSTMSGRRLHDRRVRRRLCGTDHQLAVVTLVNLRPGRHIEPAQDELDLTPGENRLLKWWLHIPMRRIRRACQIPLLGELLIPGRSNASLSGLLIQSPSGLAPKRKP
ncbi:hypothetical protein BC834DRAFT_847491 [Gloeopeniophorella convolvens]|nr:hypothetical protein BC834DRAFT_847491 [Gloeopeniophorella convolvens]